MKRIIQSTLPRTLWELPAAARRPIGTLGDLGTARQWALEIAGFAMAAAVLVGLLICF